MPLSLPLLVLLSSLAAAATKNTTTTVHLRLIHRHSIFPPPADNKKGESVRQPMSPADDATLFLVNISIGDPPSPQLLAMDTGSPLIWVHCCLGCSYSFDPDRSITYAEIPSSSPQCLAFSPSSSPHQEFSDCRFSIAYEDGSWTTGDLARDTFTLATPDGGPLALPDVVFGCAADTGGGARSLGGVLGVEAHSPYHLVARMGNKFSYCIGDVWDRGYAYNQLVLGEGAVIQGDSTPMRVVQGHYSVTLEGISVGGRELSIDQDEFYYNVVVDSGSTLMELRGSGYEAVVGEVERLIGGSMARVVDSEGFVCYEGEMERDLEGFPVVTLQLAEGAEIEMDVGAVFRRKHHGVFCLAVVRTEKTNVIGVMAQQYYNVGFDLNQMRISFQRIECELLEDD